MSFQCAPLSVVQSSRLPVETHPVLGPSSLKSLTGSALTGILAICSGVNCGGEPVLVCAPALAAKAIVNNARTKIIQRNFMHNSFGRKPRLPAGACQVRLVMYSLVTYLRRSAAEAGARTRTAKGENCGIGGFRAGWGTIEPKRARLPERAVRGRAAQA